MTRRVSTKAVRKGAAQAMCYTLDMAINARNEQLARRYARAILNHKWLDVPKRRRMAALRNIEEVRRLAQDIVGEA